MLRSADDEVSKLANAGAGVGAGSEAPKPPSENEPKYDHNVTNINKPWELASYKFEDKRQPQGDPIKLREAMKEEEVCRHGKAGRVGCKH